MIHGIAIVALRNQGKCFQSGAMHTCVRPPRLGGVFANHPVCNQQIIHESRLPTSDFGRVFPHDRKNAACAISQGLLHRESFIEGLSPIAFFVHAIFGHTGQ